MACGEQCLGQVDIAKALSSLEVNQWHTLKIDLQCFEEKGADMSKITSPFVLSTATPLTIDFTDIFIKTKSVDSVSVSCD